MQFLQCFGSISMSSMFIPSIVRVAGRSAAAAAAGDGAAVTNVSISSSATARDSADRLRCGIMWRTRVVAITCCSLLVCAFACADCGWLVTLRSRCCLCRQPLECQRNKTSNI